MYAGYKIISKSCILQAMHTRAVGYIGSLNYEQLGTEGDSKTHGQQDGIVYGPGFSITSFTSLMAVDTKSACFMAWKDHFLAPECGTPGEVFEHVWDLVSAPSCIWKWTHKS